MPGGNEPKAKKRRKGGDRKDKEKPLLVIQGLLKLDHCFVKPKNEDAEVIEVQAGDKKMKIVMAPDESMKSEHDTVAYRSGYDTGPTNPLPQDEREEVLFAHKKVYDDAAEYFEEMKKETEEKRAEREEVWAEKELSEKEKEEAAELRRAKKEAKRKRKAEKAGDIPEIDPSAYGYAKDNDPDNPENYHAPDEETPFGSLARGEPGLPGLAIQTGGEKEKGEKEKKKEVLVEGPLKPPGEEDEPEENMEITHMEGDTRTVVLDEGSTRTVVLGEGEEQSGEQGPSQMKTLPGDEEEDTMETDLTSENVVDMATAVALEMEEKRRKEEWEKMEVEVKTKESARIQREAEDLQREAERSELSLDELTTLRQLEAKLGHALGQSQGPMIPEPGVGDDYNQRQILDAYWEFVRENPQDFNGWAYLIQAAETVDIMDEIRTVYNAFLPLFPYCYAYWKRYSDLERKKENWQRSLQILHRGLEAIPLSVDLWLAYLELFHKMYSTHDNFQSLFRAQCEKAIATCGIEYRSDSLWEYFIEREIEAKNLRFATDLFRRVISIPTKLYNKHWDNFIAHVRDHHPRDILQYEDYESLRKLTCRELQLTYRPDPVVQPEQERKVELPEDKLKAGMKERLVASLVVAHETTEARVDEMYMFEEKLKRNYFHVKPLDHKQLKTWDMYLDYEIRKGDHERIVVLFERCLIPCALYEQFWAKYARYLEKAHKEKKDLPRVVEEEIDENGIRKARSAFNTGLDKVDELQDKRTTWTMRGWRETLKDGTQVMRAEKITTKDLEAEKAETAEKKEKAAAELKADEGFEKDGDKENENNENKENEETDKDEKAEGEKEGSEKETKTYSNDIDAEMSMVVISSAWMEKRGWEAVRDVYKRACIVHCPKRAVIKMKWAAFEENVNNIEEAREILRLLIAKYPMLLEARMQQIDLERRQKSLDVADKMYTKLMKQIPTKHDKYRNMKTWIAMKYARFQFKVCNDVEKALAALRTALKKERGNARLYSQIIDMCYQRTPIDVNGVTAALELSLVSKDLSNMEKLEFVKRKVEFMQEFGDVGRYRDAWDQLKGFRHLCSADLKVEAKRKKELEAEEKRYRELEEMKSQARAEVNMKAKLAEAEGRLLCSKCQGDMLPNKDGVYEFETFRPGYSGVVPYSENPAEQPVQVAEEGVIDLMDFNMDPDEEEKIRQSLQEKTKYKEVAPTWELNIEKYGYGAKRRAYDPDYEHVENSKYREYERLEMEGYDEGIKDPEDNRKRNVQAVGLGHKPGEFTPGEKKYTTSDYIIPPKVPQMSNSVVKGKPSAPGDLTEHEMHAFELPPELADPQKSPCVNVPEWFVREGGELCLSDTANGTSIIRYWPKFLSEKGNDLMLTRLRKYCRWHQKQVKVGGEWKYQPRLVSWYGPCDYAYSGLVMEKNLNWAPELLDLLHRLIGMTRHEFNSCFLNLYRHGYDMCGWHSDSHPQLGRNPPVASVSLGAVRVFELRKKKGAPNFIRFPLFPGSLLLMEGAVQEDWLHCIPKDPACKEERVNLTFRIMYSAANNAF
ncbi:uncharacterized protein LOC111700016 [Eurytemora carolleeae]|uniref:uncharacterized protein LOC111700016 n=1 Tax=Eurytemora carolleeae TaxID=1294199 RepID=UPI000C76A49B|nr:uncharacterized protein LOC111700016 [Eurytemora carolleeae]XP_023326592.1 uncharacterized protein LOC111700016 [Eurytemora carolleeae]|eukprot:XP_023326591.1 uncharacterized protein LOC111700016 [Eurytemora affinis]